MRKIKTQLIYALNIKKVNKCGKKTRNMKQMKEETRNKAFCLLFQSFFVLLRLNYMY